MNELKTRRQEQREQDARRILSQHGYTIKQDGRRFELWSKGIRGWSSPSLVRRATSFHAAIESAAPIIADASFLAAVQELGYCK